MAWRGAVARAKVRRYAHETYWGKPIPGFGDPLARLLIVGLAPAAHGGNRTGRMFTGDSSGDWLYEALHRFGFANQPTSVSREDGLTLTDCFITAAARCAPPKNKPTPKELDNCRPWLEAELALLDRVRVVVALGRIGFAAFLKTRSATAPFAHGAERRFDDGTLLIASYHPSRQNTNTGRLTRPMWHAIFQRARAALLLALLAAPRLRAQDTLHPPVLPPLSVSVTRDERQMKDVPGAVSVVSGPDIARARPTWGLDEALATVPGVHDFNRYNFSLDQRLSMRGFGARSSFGVRGVKVLLDGIPQTLPDGSGQLTNVELGAADRIEVWRGPASALFGNASGGVVSIRSDQARPELFSEEVRLESGSFYRDQLSNWTKWLSSSVVPLGSGSVRLVASKFSYAGERQHSDADFRNLNVHTVSPLGAGLTLTGIADFGNDPQADNPGALTAAELAKNPDSAAAINLTKHAGKDVSQAQVALALHDSLAGGGEASLAVFAFARDLHNPQTFAYIRLRRAAYGVRATLHRAGFTVGLDLQRQRDDRLNTGNNAGQPDTVRQLDQLEHVTELGLFAQDALALDARTMLTAGLRYDRVSFAATDRLITPTNPDDSGERVMGAPSIFLGLTRQAGERATLYANIGTSFETPTTTELANRPDSAGGFNTGLEPQRAVSFEVGARGSQGRLSWSVTPFVAFVGNELIAYQVPTSPGRTFFQNAGHSRHAGLEVSAAAALNPWLSVRAAWTAADYRYTDYTASGHDLSGRRVPGIPAQQLHVLWQVRPSFARGCWAEIEHTHSSSVLVDDTLATTAGGWWRADVRLGWDGAAAGALLSPFVAMNNVFDAHYVGSVVINAAAGRYYESAPGRNVYVGLTIRASR